MAKRTTKYTRQAILNLVMKEVSSNVFALALCNPDGSNIGLGGVNYKGVWNANTNSPDLPGATPVKGDYYVVSVAGATSLGGIIDWKVPDWAIYNGTIWQKVDNTENAFAAAMDQGVAIADKPTFAGFISTSDSNIQADMHFIDNKAIYFGADSEGKLYSNGLKFIIETPDNTIIEIRDVSWSWWISGGQGGLDFGGSDNAVEMRISEIKFNANNQDVDFIIKKDDGSEAFKYDAGDNEFTLSSPVTFKENIISDKYTKLGSDAPNVKMKKFTGTSPVVGAMATIAHGFADISKIIGVQALVANNSGNQIPPNFTSVANHEFEFFIDATNISIYCIFANSSDIDGNAVVVLITYEA